MSIIDPGKPGKAGGTRARERIHAFRGPPALADRLAYNISEFCFLHGISRGFYYNLKKAGLGPVEMNLGGRVLISREASAAWRAAREAASDAA